MRIMSHTRAVIKLSLIFIMVQSAWCQWKPINRRKEALCKTLECKARGKEYKNNMDTRAEPCQDFFTFACGNFHNNHPGPKYASEWSLVDVMNVDFVLIIRKSLESYTYRSGGNSVFRRAKEAYETCLKIPEYPISNAKNVAREVKKIGRLSATTQLWDIHFKYLRLSGESAFFRFKILAGRASEGIPVLMVMESPSAYGSIFHDEGWKLQEKQTYYDFLFVIMKSLKLKDSDSLIKERIEKVFEFRKELHRIIERNKKKKPDPYDQLTGLELEKWFSDAVPAQTKTQKIPWTEVIEALLQNFLPETRQTKKIISVRFKQYFLDLMHLLKNVPEEILGHHMELYFVERHLIMKEDMFKLLEATSIEPHSLFRYIREKFHPRWHTCIVNHNMEEILEKLVFEKWFLKDNAEIIHQLNSRIKIAIGNQMRNSTWLNQLTRENTTAKFNALNEWIGFPPWVMVGGTAGERDKRDILTPGAILDNNANLLYVHAPLLMSPLFSRTIPTLYNYAGIGTTLGHELYHLIDDCGSYPKGNEDIVWWPPQMRTKCLSKKLLFIEAFNKISDREFKNRYNMDVKSNTSQTFLEDYPDIMGLEATYNAYKELAGKEKSVCQTLPEFEMYSCDQMFYIAFANTYCADYTKKSAKDRLDKSDHSIESVRINGAVAQMATFGTAFGCTVGSPLNPQKKLNLWQ